MLEAEREGSELAGAMQAFFLETAKDSIGYLRCLMRLAEKHPFLNANIAELYENKYSGNGDFSNIRTAIEYYYKADSYGMLTPGRANRLWSIYNRFGQKELLEFDVNEMERIKKIVGTENVE